MKPSRPYHSSTAYHREPGGLRRLDFFADRIELFAQERARSTIRILDIGCGNGNISLALATLGYAVTGFDADEQSIARARRSAEDLSLHSVSFNVGSLESVHGQKFDVIIASEVLQQQKNPAVFLSDVDALLTPDGMLLLSVPNGKSFVEYVRKNTTRVKQFFGQQDSQNVALQLHEQFFSLGEVERTLRAQSWRVVDMAQAAAMFKELYYLAGHILIKRGSGVFYALDAFDNWLSPHLPMAIADGWLIEARRFDPSRPLVMHVLPTLDSGGAERFVHDIAVRLPEKGFDPHVVSIVSSGPLEPLFRQRIPLTVLNMRGPFGLTATRGLLQLMKRERPDIVHTHLFGADLWGRVAARLAGVPVVISTEHNVNTEHGVLKRRIKGWVSQITTRFISPADVVKRNMITREYIPAKKITIIPNGIDMSRVIVRPPRGFHDVPRLISVGRLAPQKGQATLLKALALVKGAWTLEMVGVGPLEQELRELADRLSISPRIHWLGFRGDIPQRLAESDIFLFPSRWEGFGLALLEAAASGVPCIASDLPVFHEFLGKDDACFVPPSDVPALAHVIQDMLRNPFPHIERAAAAGERLRTLSSIESTAAAYAELYRDCLKNI